MQQHSLGQAGLSPEPNIVARGDDGVACREVLQLFPGGGHPDVVNAVAPGVLGHVARGIAFGFVGEGRQFVGGRAAQSFEAWGHERGSGGGKAAFQLSMQRSIDLVEVWGRWQVLKERAAGIMNAHDDDDGRRRPIRQRTSAAPASTTPPSALP